METKLKKGDLLDSKGNLNEAGYAFSLIKKYERKMIKGLKWRIKEWDYYYIGNDKYGIALTIDDNSYMNLCSLSFLDFKEGYDITKSEMGWLSFGKIGLPSSSKEGDTFYKNKNVEMSFVHEKGKRHLKAIYHNFTKDGLDAVVDVTLKETNEGSMVIATPFKKKKHFYYNQKINCLEAEGFILLGDKKYVFDKKDSLGVLDWGRGVWTYKNTWYWSSLNCIQDGKRLGFNLGYGFGDTSAASENMFFYDDKVYKLNDVIFNIPKDSKGKDLFLERWTIVSKSKEIDLEFTPIFNRHFAMDVILIGSNQNQVFGRFNGTIKVEDKIIKLENCLGFAEKVFNKW